jgi:hypothetical protein
MWWILEFFRRSFLVPILIEAQAVSSAAVCCSQEGDHVEQKDKKWVKELERVYDHRRKEGKEAGNVRRDRK